jgi:hypothetical protein
VRLIGLVFNGLRILELAAEADDRITMDGDVLLEVNPLQHQPALNRYNYNSVSVKKLRLCSLAYGLAWLPGKTLAMTYALMIPQFISIGVPSKIRRSSINSVVIDS